MLSDASDTQRRVVVIGPIVSLVVAGLTFAIVGYHGWRAVPGGVFFVLLAVYYRWFSHRTIVRTQAVQRLAKAQVDEQAAATSRIT